jgi:replicative DNA helicase
VAANKRGCAMDATTIQITTKAYLAEISQRLDEAANIAKAAQACAEAGNTKQGIAIALDVEQLVYEVNTLLNAASLINRISKG